MKMNSFFWQPQNRVLQIFKTAKIKQGLLCLLCTFSLSFMVSYSSNAQATRLASSPLPETGCVTPSPDFRKVMPASKVNELIGARLMPATYCVNVMFHVIRFSDGTDGATEAEVIDQVDNFMIPNFAAADISFIYLGVNFIDDDAAATTGDYLTYTSGTLYPAHGATNRLDIFVYPSSLGDLAGNAFAIPNDYLAMSELRFGISQNLSHEVGHTLGLLHTHETFGQTCPSTFIEKIDGTDCLTGGDLVCDTPADPQLGFGNPDWDNATCTYSGTVADCNGDSPYTPPGDNFMSYGWSCRNMFSAGQIDRMQAELMGGAVGPTMLGACPSACSITNFSATDAVCGDFPFEDDSYFTATFDVVDGSGNYILINPANNVSYGSGPGLATDGTVSFTGQASIPGVTPGGTTQVILLDMMNATCMAGPVTINVPVCPPPCSTDTEAPTVTCAEFTGFGNSCPNFHDPNTPNGSWITVPASGMFSSAVGGGVATGTIDLNGCVTDNVSALTEMEYTLMASYVENNIPGCSKDIINEYQIRDACGNVSPTTFIFRGTIQYSGPAPVITCPSNTTAVGSIDPSVTGMATATTGCGTATITFVDNTSSACGIDGVITRTWTATDGCGQTSTCDQLITVIDMTAPDVTCAEFAETFDACPDGFGPNTPDGAWFPIPASGMINNAVGGIFTSVLDVSTCITDDCSSIGEMEYTLVDSYAENVVPGCSIDLINEFGVRDASGNVSPTTFIFRGTIQYSGPAPMITCPANVVLECGASIDPMDTGMATAMSGCGTPVVTFVDNLAATCGMAGTITRTWTATDGCGQTSTCNQTITINDTTIPIVTCAEFQTTFSGCPDPIGPNTPSGAWFPIGIDGSVNTAVGGIYTSVLDLSTCVSDLCTDLADIEYSITDSYEENRVPGCSVDIINEFTIRDACGNVSPVTFNFRGTIQFDGPAPMISCPPNVVVECGNPTDPANTGMATATSACGTPAISSVDAFVGACGNTGVITRTWTATDGCGRTSTCVQTITIVDTTPPTITLPPDVVLACGEDTSPTNTGMATATDVCDGVVTVSFTDLEEVKTCDGGFILRTWTSTDVCGNTAVEMQKIEVLPPNAPTIVCPADIVVSCEDEINLDPNDAIVTTDCGLGFTAYIKQPLQSGAPGCNGTVYTYIYKVVDDCGRVASCEQQVLIQNTPASINVPTGGIVDCFADIDISLNDATVSNACADYNLYLDLPTISGQIGCPGTTYSYTYRLLDVCGNNVEETAVFINANTPPPTIQAPDDLTTTCLGGTNPNPDNAIVTAACDAGYNVSVSAPQVIGAFDCPGTIYRYTYTVTDECGRTASDTQDYVVQNTGPEFSGCQEDNWLQYNCEDYGGEAGTIAAIEAYIASVKAYSSCGAYINVLNDFNPNNVNTCTYGVPQSITFFATDNCGRTATCTTYYVITDTEAPVIFEEAQDHYEICNYNSSANFQDWVADHGGAEAFDWCSNTNINWSTIPANPSFNCIGGSGMTSMTVTFIATDNCNNSASTTATFYTFQNPGGFAEEEDKGEGESSNNSSNLNLDQNGFQAASEDKLTLYQNRPNPFKGQTLISFNLPEATQATLTIYDMNGRVLKVVSENYSQGYNEVNINRNELGATGVLYYRLMTDKEAVTKTMLIID